MTNRKRISYKEKKRIKQLKRAEIYQEFVNILDEKKDFQLSENDGHLIDDYDPVLKSLNRIAASPIKKMIANVR